MQSKEGEGGVKLSDKRAAKSSHLPLVPAARFANLRARLRRNAAAPKRGRSDWSRVDATTDREIDEQIRRNPDDVEFTDEMLATARWVMPEKKVPISFRVDPDVLAFFKSAGDGYQSRMNAVLRGYVGGHRRKVGKRRVG